MLPLAHLGIGANLARPWWKAVPIRTLVLGTLLPDLVDKPLYYVPHFLTGNVGAELGLISGTRSISHTLLFLAVLAGFAAIPGARRRWWAGLALGGATHLLLDNLPEAFSALTPYSGRIALLFPLYGWRFPLAMYRTPGEHFLAHLGPFDLAAEAIGAVLLWRLWRTRRISAS